MDPTPPPPPSPGIQHHHPISPFPSPRIQHHHHHHHHSPLHQGANITSTTTPFTRDPPPPPLPSPGIQHLHQGSNTNPLPSLHQGSNVLLRDSSFPDDKSDADGIVLLLIWCRTSGTALWSSRALAARGNCWRLSVQLATCPSAACRRAGDQQRGVFAWTSCLMTRVCLDVTWRDVAVSAGT